MTHEWLLILVFLMCAGIMKWFVKAVDKFIRYEVIPEEQKEEIAEMQVKKCTAEESEAALSDKAVSAYSEDKTDMTVREEEGMPIEEAAGIPVDAAKGLLDKLHQKSNVMHEKQGNTVEIGSALPTQIRISNYEQP